MCFAVAREGFSRLYFRVCTGPAHPAGLRGLRFVRQTLWKRSRAGRLSTRDGRQGKGPQGLLADPDRNQGLVLQVLKRKISANLGWRKREVLCAFRQGDYCE